MEAHPRTAVGTQLLGCDGGEGHAVGAAAVQVHAWKLQSTQLGPARVRKGCVDHLTPETCEARSG